MATKEKKIIQQKFSEWKYYSVMIMVTGLGMSLFFLPPEWQTFLWGLVAIMLVTFGALMFIISWRASL